MQDEEINNSDIRIYDIFIRAGTLILLINLKVETNNIEKITILL